MSDLPVQELRALSVPRWAVDRGGRFRREDDDSIVFNFGRHRGKTVESERGVLEWMLDVDFPAETKAWCRIFLRRIREQEEDLRLRHYSDLYDDEAEDDYWYDDDEDWDDDSW